MYINVIIKKYFKLNRDHVKFISGLLATILESKTALVKLFLK